MSGYFSMSSSEGEYRNGNCSVRATEVAVEKWSGDNGNVDRFGLALDGGDTAMLACSGLGIGMGFRCGLGIFFRVSDGG